MNNKIVVQLCLLVFCFNTLSCSLYGMKFYQTQTNLVTSSQANTGYQAVYRISVIASPGDYFVVYGQVEGTNDYRDPVAFSVKTVINHTSFHEFSENAMVQTNHHMPKITSLVYGVSTYGSYTIEIHFASSRSDASPYVKVESGYGMLLLEHYIIYTSIDDVFNSGSLLLESLKSSYDLTNTSFGINSAYTPITALQIYTPATNDGDILQLFGCASSLFLSKIDMHGQRIVVSDLHSGSDVAYSIYSTENNYQMAPNLPLFSRLAFTTPNSSSGHVSKLMLHGVNGGGMRISYGYLYSLLHRKTRTGFTLVSATNLTLGSTVKITANSNPITVLNWKVRVTGKSILRLSSTYQFLYPNGYSLGISCTIYILVQNTNTGVSISSQYISKYITRLSETMQLHVDLIAEVSDPGDYIAYSYSYCQREGESPTLSIGGHTNLQGLLYGKY